MSLFIFSLCIFLVLCARGIAATFLVAIPHFAFLVFVCGVWRQLFLWIYPALPFLYLCVGYGGSFSCGYTPPCLKSSSIQDFLSHTIKCLTFYSLSNNNFLTIDGLAFPLVPFIICPIRKPRAFSLPLL